ncbi:MAG TPA: sigma-70 family RNA polymerase sigma factor [Rhizomicrobium sp.]|nr:sigma-70 family RNA polymerase sigma factor [Rhizomicrobium sp.]
MPCTAERPEPHALEDIVALGRAGDRLAMKLLIERYQSRMGKFVLSQTRDPNTAEDICQAVFVKMVIGLPRLRDTGRFESWLFQIARNVCRDHLRAALGWRRYFVSYSPAHESVAEPEVPAAENKLDHGVAQLSPEDRALLQLHLEQKKSYQELAQLSNTSVSAIKSRLYRARRELRGLLLAGDSE